MTTISQKIKIKPLNYLINYTNNSKVFLERLNKSNNIIEKFSLWEKLIITGKEMILKKIKMELRNPKF